MGVSDGKQVASESPRSENAFADQHEEDSLLIRQADQIQGALLPPWPLPASSQSRRDQFSYLPSIYGALLLILLTLGGVYLLVRLQFLLILLFLSVLVACGIAGPVRRLERRGLGRAPAILIIYALIGAVVVGIGWYALPRLVGQAGAVAEDLPNQVV